MKGFATAGVFMALLSPVAASAQTLNQTGEPSAGISNRLKVTSTAPKLAKCSRRGSHCFRVFFQVVPSGEEAVDVVFIRDGQGTHAYVATGAVCEADVMADFPSLHLSYGNVIKWSDITPIVSTPTKPAIMIVEFNCDQTVLAGDNLTYQLSFFARVDGRRDGIARYVFPQTQIQ